MNTLESLQALRHERKTIGLQLKPLAAIQQSKETELAKLTSDSAGAEVALDAAVQQCSFVEGQHTIGLATASEAEAARQFRRDAEAHHQRVRPNSTRIRAVNAELAGLQAAGHDLALRLGAIDVEERQLAERHLYDLADQAAGEYKAVAEQLGTKAAELLAYNQALALANIDADILSMGFWSLFVASANLPSTRTVAGPLMNIEMAQRRQPEALAAIRAQLRAEGLSMPGLV